MSADTGDSKDARNNVTLCSYKSASERQLSSLPPTQNHSNNAVEVRRVKLTYGRGKTAKPILSEIDLSVPEGAM